MKTKLLTICLLLVTSQVFASDDLSGKKLSCYQHYYIQTYNFEDNKNFTSHRYENPKKPPRETYGKYNIPQFSEYIHLKTNAAERWRHYRINRKTLRVDFCDYGNCDRAGLEYYCKLFKGTLQELKEHAQKENVKRINTINEKQKKEKLKEKKEWEKKKKKFKL